MSTKKKSDAKNQRLIDSCDYLGPAASSMDCTGLIPANPWSDAAMESYNEVYHYEPPTVPVKKK